MNVQTCWSFSIMDIRKHFSPTTSLSKPSSSKFVIAPKTPQKHVEAVPSPRKEFKLAQRYKKPDIIPGVLSDSDMEDPLPSKKISSKKEKSRKPSKRKISEAESDEVEFLEEPKHKSKLPHVDERRMSPRKSKLKMKDDEEVLKKSTVSSKSAVTSTSKPTIVRPPPASSSTTANNRQKRKTNRISILDSDSDPEEVLPRPSPERKKPTRASPVSRKSNSHSTRPQSREKKQPEEVEFIPESPVKRGKRKAEDHQQTTSTSSPQKKISDFGEPFKRAKGTDAQSVKSSLVKSKPLPMVTPSEYFGVKSKKPKESEPSKKAVVDTKKPTKPTITETVEVSDDSDFEDILGRPIKPLETPALVKAKLSEVPKAKPVVEVPKAKTLAEVPKAKTLAEVPKAKPVKEVPSKPVSSKHLDTNVDVAPVEKIAVMEKKDESPILPATDKVVSSPKVMKVKEKADSASTSTVLKPAVTSPISPVLSQSSQNSSQSSTLYHMWVEKYKPKTLKQVVGQQGDKSPANKLLAWLRNWAKFHLGSSAGKVKGVKFDDGSTCKAALLSGPPGIGKTTTELGLTYVEFNASDARNKKIMDNQLADSLESQSMDQFTARNVKSDCAGIRHVLIMDEVDGMSGNEDRGGIQELIQLIKRSKVPLICICNDRQDAKMRTLSNYCYDLRFTRPRTEQIRGAIMSVAFKEGLKISAPAVDQIIEGSNHDIRQILNLLSVWSSTDKVINIESATADSGKAKKDTVVNPFEITRLIFSDPKEGPKLGIAEKSDLFFHDYNVMPLFIQENYINVVPHAAKTNLEKLTLMSEVADCLAMSDVCEKMIRNTNNWTLLPSQAMLTTVIPGEVLKGHMQGMINFPSWFGKNSKQNKVKRLVTQLHKHMSLHVSADLQSFAQLYLPTFRQSFTRPLLNDESGGVQTVFKAAHHYNLQRQDLDDILEITQWPDKFDPMSKVPSKTKAALTRLFTKEGSKLPYATLGNTGGKKRKAAAANDVDDELQFDEDGNPIQTAVEDEESEETGDNVVDDGMIKKKEVSKTSGKATTSKAKPTTSRKKKT